MKQQVFNPYLPSWEYVPDGEPHVFGDRWLAHLHLRAAESLRTRGERFVDDLLHIVMQPAALGGVDRHAALGAPRHLPQRQPGAQATQVPQRRVDGGEHKEKQAPGQKTGQTP